MRRLCEHWLLSRRQCRRIATVQIDDLPPRYFCPQHARLYQWGDR